MSIDTVIFLIGAILTALTIYGSVMALGLRLTRRQIADSSDLGNDVSSAELAKTLPTDVKY